MPTTLTWTGQLWACLSLLSAIAMSVGFYLPFWIQGTLFNRIPTYFGSFRRCTYPRITDSGSIVVVEECGRYTTFSDIPSISWQICSILVGVGCCLALLIGFTSIAACCLTDVITKNTGRAAGIIQFTAAMLSVVGLAIYPNGWHSREVREACGGNSDAFDLGTCKFSWSFYLMSGGVGCLMICVMLSFNASRVKNGVYRI